MRVRIAKLALRTLPDRRFHVRHFLQRQQPALIGVDLHWMPHSHGAIVIARLCKEVHPRVPVGFGGLSCTYFHRQLLDDRGRVRVNPLSSIPVSLDCVDVRSTTMVLALKGCGIGVW